MNLKSLLRNFFFFCVYFFVLGVGNAEEEFLLEDYKFISYGKLSSWKGIVVDWKISPKAFIYDRRVFKGHADFISKGLGKKITFEEFKLKSKHSAQREYLPFYIYDLRDKEIEFQNRKIQFAIRLQDYNYDDTPVKMAKEIVKLVEILQRDSDGVIKNDLLIVLNRKKENALSIHTIGDLITQAEFVPISLDRLLGITGSKTLEVLNSGVAVGKLVRVKNEKELPFLTKEDIAVLSFLPDRIPPVAGIITLKPQTPLSHVNLLAKNRGTFNMYITDMNAIPNLKSLLGKYVYLSDLQNEVSIHRIDKKFVENYRLKNPPPRVEIPVTEKKFSRVLPLIPKYSQYTTVAHIGAKAANYFRIRQLFPDLVKPAFAIGFKPYENVINQGAREKIGELLENKSVWNVAKRNKKLKEIRDYIRIANIPQITIQSLRATIQKHFPETRIRLRSSTNCEDLKDFNGAGLYVSKGFQTVGNDDELSEKILEVYASFWNEYAFEEREYYGISHLQTGMAILIHEAFVEEKANGIALTIPSNSAPDILINVQADNISVANPVEGYIAESFYLQKNKPLVGKVNTRSNVRGIFIDNPNYDEILSELRKSILKIHSEFTESIVSEQEKFGIDIEFKIMKENGIPKLYIKQARILKY